MFWGGNDIVGSENGFMIEIAAGFLSGIISGMGIGGGMILIPALVFFLLLPQVEAQAINLWYFLPTAIIAIVLHIKNKNIELKKAAWIIACGLPSAALGAYCATCISRGVLGKLFGVFLAIFGIKEVYDGFTNKK